MSDLLDELVEVLDGAKRYESYIAAICCFHDDHRPSLIIHSDYYHCLACDAHGTTKSLLDKIKGNPPKPRLTSWHNPFTGWLREQSLNRLMTSAWRFLKDNPHYGKYLEKRSIPRELQNDLGIGWRDGFFTFPVLDKNRALVGAVARVGEGLELSYKYIYPAGQNPNLLYVPSWERVYSALKKSKDIYVVFGILDSVSLVVYDLPGISTTSGQRLDPFALDDFRPSKIVFIPDRGEEISAMKIAMKLGGRGSIMKAFWPEDTKDVNDVVVKFPNLLQATFGIKGFG